MMADVMIVSIDESSFKQEGVPARYWQSDATTLKQLFVPAACTPPPQGVNTVDQQH
jgi:hypothetical protein